LIRLIARWASSLALGLLIAGPLAAVTACALVDRGPEGEVRASLFPLALAALDPFVWTCTRQSATAAALATLLAMGAGVFLGRLIGERGFRLRRPTFALLAATAAFPPVVLAMGATLILGAEGADAWSGMLERLGPWGRRLPVDPGWLVWLASAAIPGAAASTLAYATALDRLDPSWRDAARLAGGVGTRAWRRLAWPLLRPAMARVAAFVFATTLVDPGPPLILGLRRTFGYQIVVAAFEARPFPRMAGLALIAILACAGVRAILRAWSGPARLTSSRPATRDDAPARPPASWARLATLGLILTVGGVLVAAPLVGLAREAGPGISASGTRESDPELARVLFRSVALGCAVAALSAVAGRALGRLEAGAGPAASGRFRKLARLVAPAPLVAGVVILSFGSLLRLGVERFGSRSPAAAAGSIAWWEGEAGAFAATALAVWLATAAAGLDGRRHPRGAGAASARDAAILFGAGRRRARRLARGGGGWRGWRGFAATAAAASANVAPAVLFAASTRGATLGPGLLLAFERPGGGAAVAASLALAAAVAGVASAALDPHERTGRGG